MNLSEKQAPARPGTEGWTAFLTAVPVRNQAAREEPRSGGIAITIEVRRPAWLIAPISWVFPVRNERVVKLDAIGTGIWRACDGKRRVANIVDDVAKEERLTFHEARVAVTQYLRDLVQRGVVVLEVDPNSEGRLAA